MKFEVISNRSLEPDLYSFNGEHKVGKIFTLNASGVLMRLAFLHFRSFSVAMYSFFGNIRIPLLSGTPNWIESNLLISLTLHLKEFKWHIWSWLVLFYANAFVYEWLPNMLLSIAASLENKWVERDAITNKFITIPPHEGRASRNANPFFMGSKFTTYVTYLCYNKKLRWANGGRETKH